MLALNFHHKSYLPKGSHLVKLPSLQSYEWKNMPILTNTGTLENKTTWTFIIYWLESLGRVTAHRVAVLTKITRLNKR